MSGNVSPIALVRRFGELDRLRQRLLLEAAVGLMSAKIALHVIPFRRVVRLVNRVQRNAPPFSAADVIIAASVAAVNTASRRLPWRTVCIDRGLTLHVLLRARGIRSVLNYGVRRSRGGALEAHVWITVDEVALIGGQEAEGFARVGRF